MRTFDFVEMAMRVIKTWESVKTESSTVLNSCISFICATVSYTIINKNQ